MTKPSKKRGPSAKRRAQRRAPLQPKKSKSQFAIEKIGLARALFGDVMREVCPQGAHHLSDTLDGVVRVLTVYTSQKYAETT